MNSSSVVLIVGYRLIGWRDGVNGTARCRGDAFAVVTSSPAVCTDVANNT